MESTNQTIKIHSHRHIIDNCCGYCSKNPKHKWEAEVIVNGEPQRIAIVWEPPYKAKNGFPAQKHGCYLGYMKINGQNQMIGFSDYNEVGYILKTIKLILNGDLSMFDKFGRCKATPEYFDVNKPTKESLLNKFTEFLTEQNILDLVIANLKTQGDTMVNYINRMVCPEDYIFHHIDWSTTQPKGQGVKFWSRIDKAWRATIKTI